MRMTWPLGVGKSNCDLLRKRLVVPKGALLSTSGVEEEKQSGRFLSRTGAPRMLCVTPTLGKVLSIKIA